MMMMMMITKTLIIFRFPIGAIIIINITLSTPCAIIRTANHLLILVNIHNAVIPFPVGHVIAIGQSYFPSSRRTTHSPSVSRCAGDSLEGTSMEVARHAIQMDPDRLQI